VISVVKIKYCPKCGKPLKEGYTFCGKCGSKIIKTETIEKEPEKIFVEKNNAEVTQEKTEDKKKISRIYWVVATVCVVIILISIFFLFQFKVIGEKAEITEYSVTTVYNKKECKLGLLNTATGEYECTQWEISDEIIEIPSFYKSLPDDAANVRYEVTFKVENKAGKHLDIIGLKAIFCDANNNELCFKIASVYNIPNSYTKESIVTIYKSESSYFYNIEKVRFEIIVD
jgi:hypothetical protein